MRIYSASGEETLRARNLLKDWADEGFLTPEQYEHLKRENVSKLRTSNIFLRIVLFLFTLICVAALAALVGVSFLRGSSDQTLGIFLLIYAAICYWVAETAVSRADLYRYGIEEALAACSIVYLCLGMQMTFFSGVPYSAHSLEFLVPAFGAVLSLWIWHRFGLWYAFPAAMIFALFVPDSWTTSHAARHVIVAALYAIGLVTRIAVDSWRKPCFADDDYSLAEAFLWLGLYLEINLQLSSVPLRGLWGNGGSTQSEFAGWFYWSTWVLIWIVPPVILARGIRRRDRLVIAAGMVTAVLTLITNKPYLGWPRHTWDPIILGLLLIGVALFLRRWLGSGAGGIRHGFTAAHLWAKDREWMNVGGTALGLITPQAITPQAKAADFRFGGGASGGGGAGGEF